MRGRSFTLAEVPFGVVVRHDADPVAVVYEDLEEALAALGLAAEADS